MMKNVVKISIKKKTLLLIIKDCECCVDGLLDLNDETGKRGSGFMADLEDAERKYFVRYGDDYIDLVSESNIEKVNMENMKNMEINVKFTDDDDLKIISVKPIDNIYEAVLKGLGKIRFRHIKNNIYFEKKILYIVDRCYIQKFNGIEDGATLNVNIRKKGFNEILDDIIELNPHLRDRREER